MSDLEFKRSHRISELIQHELANLITHDLKDPRVGFVTVTEVRATSDLKQAKVFVSVYGTDAQRKDSLLGLEKASGFLKREIGHRLKLRHVPELLFVHDDSLDRADRLQEIFGAIKKGELEAPDPNAKELVPVHTDRSELAEKKRLFDELQKKPTNKKGRGRRGRAGR